MKNKKEREKRKKNLHILVLMFVLITAIFMYDKINNLGAYDNFWICISYFLLVFGTIYEGYYYLKAKKKK